MNKASGLVLLLALGCTTATVLSRTPADASAVEATIRQLEEQERLAVLNRDTVVLQRLWSEQFMVNSPFNTISPNARVVLDLVRQGLIHYSSFERRIEQLRVDGDIVVVMGAETVRAAGPVPIAGQVAQRRFTHVWRNSGGEWRLIARHANSIPAGPPA